MDTLADYDAWKSKRQQASAAAAGIVLDTVNVQPDEVAGDIQLAQEYAKSTGRPAPPLSMVMENRSIFQQQIERKRNSTLLSSSPMLAEWLRKPENAALARDDLEGLSLWEIIGSNIKEAGKAVPGGAVSSLGTAMEGAGQILTPRDPSDRAPLAQSIAGAGRKTPEEIAALRAEIFQQGVINPQVAQSVLSDVIAGDMTMEEALTALEPALAPALGAASEALQSGGEAVQDFGAGILPAAQGMEDSFGRDVGSGLGSLLTILGVGLVTGGSGAAVFGGAAGAGEAASRARRGGQDEDTQTIAALYGIFPGMTDAIPIERLIANPVVKSGLASILRSIGKQVALEGGQEAVQNILQNAIAKNLYAPDQDPFDGVMRAIQTGGFVGGLVEAGRIGLNAIMPGRYRRAQQAAGRAEEAEAKIKEIQSASVTSVLRNRMPDAFRDFVARATANGPVENVYVPASEWVEYFQSSGVDPFLLADELDGVNADDLRTALATGGDVQIPTATYAAKMAGSDHDAFLMENMRFDPDEMTAREAREFNERAQDAMQEAFEEADRMRQDDEQYRSFEAQIYDDMVSRLRVAGRSTDVATSEAMLYPAFYRVMAERSGLTTEEFLARYPLPQVRGDVPQGMQLKNVDALTRTLAEARAQKAVGVDRRQSLLEFISDYGGIADRGGELKARDAEVVDRGRGKKKLRLARKGVAAGMRDMFGSAGRKFGPDDVALAAIEAGFMADHPVVLAYKEALANGGQVPDIGAALWDAIDAEIGGMQQFSVDQAAPEVGTDADEIERYLSTIGLSLDDSDDAIRSAVEADQAAEMRRYGQRAVNPESDAFKKWFGNSKVVDASGNPLVVYHGTRDDIDAFSPSMEDGRIGVYFTKDPDYAADYSLGKSGSVEGARTMPVYLRIENPLIIKGPGFLAKVKARLTGKKPDHRGPQTAYITTDRWADLEAQGYDGIINEEMNEIIVFSPTQIKSVNNRGTFDPNDDRLLFQSGDVRGARGSVQFPLAGVGNGDSVISLFKSADLSTFIHESGHYFLTVMQDLSARGELRGASEPAIPPKMVRVYHSGAAGEGQTGRWVSTNKTYASNYRGDLPLFYMDLPESDPRLNNVDYPDQGVKQGFTFNFETTPDEAARLREIPRADDPAVTDFAAIKEWWRSNAADVVKDAARVMPDVKLTPDDVLAALDNGSTGDLMKDAAVDVGMQEQWARAFEAYLLEGKAPSIELRGAFEKFRAWLVSIYKKLAGLNVSPSDELLAVFDRMLATDDEIAKARQSASDAAPVFATAEEMGLSPEDYAAFLKLRDQSIDEAHAKLLAETMAPIKREREKWYREERAKVREDVEIDVSSQRVYRAIEWMGNRRWFGDAQPEAMGDIRLSKDILVDRYGAGVLKTLPRGKQTVYAVEGGLDPDDAAGVFGYGSGDELVKAMEQAPGRKQAIEDQTDRVMFERHGDVLRDGQIEAAAMDAVHGDKRAQALAVELKALVEVSGSDRGLTHKEAREIARQTLSRAKVRDAMNANRYIAAERKAGEEAQRLASTVTRTGMWMAAARRRVAVKARAAVRADDTAAVASVPPQIERVNDTTGRYNENVAKLVEAKRRQLLNHALYSEARRIGDEVEAAERLVARLEKSTRKIRSGRKRMGETSIPGDYVEAIEAIIYGYEFRKVSGAKIDRRSALLEYVEQMTADGRANELAIPADVLNDARVVNYRSLPVEHLRGVVDSLKNIEHTAREAGKVLINNRKMAFEEATANVARAISENVKGRPVHWVKDDRATTKAREFISGYISTLQSSTTILRQLDGREDMGVVYETLKSDMDAAAYTERDMRKEATEKILGLYSVYSPDEQRQMAVRMVIPELGGQSFSKWNLISMALNMGNEGNLARLTNKNALMHLTPDQVDAVKGLLDARDAKFVQSVWDYINSFRPKISERDRRIRGVEPTWVEPMPVEIAGVTLRGGYYPIKYEGRLGGAVFSSGDSDADILNSMMSSGYSSAQTKNGHLKARGEHIKQSLTLDVSVIAQHANEVIHDLAFSEAVVNTWRILTNGKVEQAMLGAGLDAQHKMLKLWVQDAASGQVSAGSGLAKSVQFVRSGFTYSKLALNLKTILLQPLGLMQSAVVVGKKNLAYQTMRYVQNPVEMTNDVLARSRMMWERRQTFNKDLMDAVAQSNIASPTAGKIRTAMDDYIIPFGMAGITYTQFYVVDVPTWAAAFQKGLKQFGGDEVKSAQFADVTVQRSQGSGVWSDRSGIERGTLSQTMRQNPFVMLLTTLGSYFFAKMNLIVERTQGLRAEPVSVGASMSYALDMALLLAGEAAVVALVKEAFDDDEDDDDNIAATIAMEAAKTFVAGLPVVRDIAGLSQGFQAGTYASILDTVWAPLKQASQGEVDKALVKSVVNLTGMLTRLPASQANRVIDGAWREMEGEDVSVIEYLMGKSKK